jgi:hypothetical protein
MPRFTRLSDIYKRGDDRANPFQIAFEDVLQEALLLDHSISQDAGDWEAYCLRRISPHSDEELRMIKARLDRYGVTDMRGIGASEAELLEFVLSKRSHRVVTVVGDVGVGKSSFLRYIFRHLCASTPPLDQLVAICCDLRASTPGSRSLSIRQLAHQMAKGTRQARTYYHTLGDKRVERCLTTANQYLKKAASSTSTAETSVLLLDALQALGDITRAKHPDGCARIPILVLDNVDLLSADAIPSVLSLGHAAHDSAGVAVVLAVRPSTYASSVELAEEKGAFIRYSLELPEIDVRDLVESRISLASRVIAGAVGGVLSRRVELNGWRFRLQDVAQGLSEIVVDLLRDEPREMLRSLSNGNTRKLLILLERMFRNRNLPERFARLALLQSAARSRALPRGQALFRAQYFVTAIMAGDQACYRDDGTVPNIYSCVRSRIRNDYLILHRLLALLEWRQGLVGKWQVEGDMKGLGYSSTGVQEALEGALKNGLIASPETMNSLSEARSLHITRKGRYLLTHLVQDEDYTYNVIQDTPLPLPLPASQKNADTFEARTRRCTELLRLILDKETTQAELLAETGNGRLAAVLSSVGTLSRALLTSCEGLARAGGRSSSKNVARAAAAMAEKLASFQEGAAALECRLSDVAGATQTGSTDFYEETLRLGSDTTLVLTLPKEFVRGQADVVRLALVVNDAPSALPRQVIAICSTASPLAHPEQSIIMLNRRGRTRTYGGLFRFWLAAAREDVPRFRLQFLGDCVPLGQCEHVQDAGSIRESNAES